MSLDVSDAIALAKDLLKTGIDFRPHDPDMAEEFMSRALQICDDLGIDRALIVENQSLLDQDFGPAGDDPREPTRAYPRAAPMDDDALVLDSQPLIAEPLSDLDDDLVLGDDRSTLLADPMDQDAIDEDTKQTSRQLRDLLQQQARVLENSRDLHAQDEPPAKRRGFKLFGRSNDQPFAALQSA